MEEIDFEVTLKTSELFSFTMRHTYCSVSGVFSLLISFGSLLLFLINFQEFSMTTDIVLLFIAALFTVIQPFMLYIKCSAQIKKNENINEALHYTLSEDGLCVCQGEQTAQVKWYEMRKAVYAKKGLYLYMSPVRAFIFPKEQCGENYHKICAFVSAQIKKYKDYAVEEQKEADEENAEQEQAK